MNNKLIYKYIAGYIIALILGFVATSLIVSKMTYNSELKQEAASLYEEAAAISNGYCNGYYSGLLTEADFKTQLTIVNAYLKGNIMLLSPDGTVVADTSGENISVVTDFDPTDTGNHSYIVGNFYGLFDKDHISAFYPVQYSYSIRGYVVVSRPLSQLRAHSDKIFNYNYLTLGIGFGLASIFTVLFIYNITIPLRKITEATARLAKGDFSAPLKLGRNDEIGRLSDSLDYMASEINNLNEYQSKFIANVSHDFRSPLTSIKGYLEAMLDGTIPPEMQEKYLNIVISETERLTKLTNNLLTLNNMSGGAVLDITDFNIVDIIKQTLQTFEGICEKKKIKFKLVLSDKILMTAADQSKIQQVIYNLVDNAIKFSSSESSIIISVQEKGDKVITSIKDFGIGIPKDSLPKIWERFYKTDLSRGKDKKGTGLGLSIVKDIITAHKEYIDVISTEGVGTEFIFALPKSKPSKTGFGLSLDD